MDRREVIRAVGLVAAAVVAGIRVTDSAPVYIDDATAQRLRDYWEKGLSETDVRRVVVAEREARGNEYG